MNIKFNFVRLANKDVIATSLCPFYKKHYATFDWYDHYYKEEGKAYYYDYENGKLVQKSQDDGTGLDTGWFHLVWDGEGFDYEPCPNKHQKETSHPHEIAD